MKVLQVTKNPNMNLAMYLVVEEGAGYLVNFKGVNESAKASFGYMCPCCMWRSDLENINNAVLAHINSGTITSKVKWCCHEGDADHGNHVEEITSGALKQCHFEAGSAYDMSSQAQAALVALATV